MTHGFRRLEDSITQDILAGQGIAAEHDTKVRIIWIWYF